MVLKTVLIITAVPQGLSLYRFGVVTGRARLYHIWTKQKSFPWLYAVRQLMTGTSIIVVADVRRLCDIFTVAAPATHIQVSAGVGQLETIRCFKNLYNTSLNINNFPMNNNIINNNNIPLEYISYPKAGVGSYPESRTKGITANVRLPMKSSHLKLKLQYTFTAYD
jgi:hypothetical protein